MSSQQYLNEMKNIQENLLDFLDSDSTDDQYFKNLIQIFDDLKIFDDQHKVKSILYLLIRISDNYHREPNFFSKIERILVFFKDCMKKYFSNSEIFHIFNSNKRILLFLIEEQMMLIDRNIAKEMITNFNYIIRKYFQYFQPELNLFTNDNGSPKELPENFYIERKIGENDSFICKLIQKDMIDDFISYINKTNYPLNASIQPSIYETNQFLEDKQPTLIEYSAFYGSIQVFQYLMHNKVDLTPSLYLYGIHSNNPEIIYLLEQNKIQMEEESFQECLNESIKCHNNNFAMYFKDNFIKKVVNTPSFLFPNEFTYGFQFYNFKFIPIEIEKQIFFYYAIEYDYFKLVECFKNIKGLNINEKIDNNGI